MIQTSVPTDPLESLSKVRDAARHQRMGIRPKVLSPLSPDRLCIISETINNYWLHPQQGTPWRAPPMAAPSNLQKSIRPRARSTHT